MLKSQQPWVLSQHPPTQCDLRGAADEAALNNLHEKKNSKKSPFDNFSVKIYSADIPSIIERKDDNEVPAADPPSIRLCVPDWGFCRYDTITFYAPMIYTGPYIMFWMRAYPYEGKW
jgi:hypothetical protein